MRAWTQQEAIELCTALEKIAPDFGAHVALTGGLLYKPGARTDCDILFYRIRQVNQIDIEPMFNAFNTLVEGFQQTSGFGWCYKAEYFGRKIDCFFPEEQGGEYEPNEP